MQLILVKCVCLDNDFRITVCIADEASEVHTDYAHPRNESDSMLGLTKRDIPGASLNSKNPTELSVIQLKRWLICRGAPVGGKKPELIQRHGKR